MWRSHSCAAPPIPNRTPPLTRGGTVDEAVLVPSAMIAATLGESALAEKGKSRVVLLEAAMAAANGLTFDDALALVTIDAAKILGVANRVGSIERGKDADFALFDGDPFEYATHVTGVVIDGVVVSEEVR